MLGVFEINRNDEKVAELLKEHGIQATKSKIRAWRSPPDSSCFRAMPDVALIAFFEVLKAYKGDFVRLKEEFN